MRLIDADACPMLFDEEFKKTRKLILEGESHLDNLAEGFTEAHRAIQKIPTIEAEPVKHGMWLLRHEGHGHYWECSVCHKNPCIYVTKDTKYCPNCGCKMDLEEI